MAAACYITRRTLHTKAARDFLFSLSNLSFPGFQESVHIPHCIESSVLCFYFATAPIYEVKLG